jgi:hypothetical protein
MLETYTTGASLVHCYSQGSGIMRADYRGPIGQLAHSRLYYAGLMQRSLGFRATIERFDQALFMLDGMLQVPDWLLGSPASAIICSAEQLPVAASYAMQCCASGLVRMAFLVSQTEDVLEWCSRQRAART